MSALSDLIEENEEKDAKIGALARCVFVVNSIPYLHIAEAAAEELAHLREYEETYKRVIAEQCAPDESHCTCVPALRSRISELTQALKGILKHVSPLNDLPEVVAARKLLGGE